MKKILIIIILIFFIQSKAISSQCTQEYRCQEITPAKNTIGTVVSKMTGFDFLQIKGVEFAISHYVRKELNNDIKVDIKTKSFNALKKGEFEQASVTAKKLIIEDIVLSDFKSVTLCPYNKILLKNNDYKFPYNIPAEFSAIITNDNLNTIIAKLADKINENFGGNTIVNASLSNSKLNLCIDVRTPLINKSYKFSLGLIVKNNRIVFTNNNKSTNSIILKKIMNFTARLYPLNYSLKIGQNAYCYINVNDLKIVDDKIYLKGMFLIPKNCDITE